MKLAFNFGFSGGHLMAEVDTFEDADKVLEYAVKRGVINISVQTPEGDVVEADVAAFEDATPLEKPPFDEVTDQVAEQVTPEATPEVTVEDAQKAVKDYAAKHGIEKGRELLATFGFKRTNEITADKAAEVVGACNE